MFGEFCRRKSVTLIYYGRFIVGRIKILHVRRLHKERGGTSGGCGGWAAWRYGNDGGLYVFLFFFLEC